MDAPCGAMILAAGRGERMRPLSDTCPKPLLRVGGKPLIAWQLEALRRAGFGDIVINASHLAPQLIDALGDGSGHGVRIRWSLEREPLETAGGIATALELLPPGPALIVSGDIWSDFDYAALGTRIDAMAERRDTPRVHLVMVPNPPFHRQGDFALRDGKVESTGEPRFTYGNIGVYHTALFGELPRGVKLKLLPLYRQWIAAGIVSGELHTGRWANVGTPDELTRLDTFLQSRAAPPKASA